VAASFKVGAIGCLLLRDGGGGLPVEVLFENAPVDERDAALGDRMEADGMVLAPYNCLLVRVGSEVVLVDAGLGRYEHPFGGAGGRLEEELRRTGLAPDQIDTVVVTHGHPDHIGGLCGDSGPRFGRARHIISRTEWGLWAEDGRLADPETVAHDQIPPVEEAGLIELVDAPVEVADGVRLLPAPGHTPGQLAVELGAGALYLADVVVDELHVERPDWTMEFDADPVPTVETRRRLLGRAAAEHLSVAASHLAAPARVQRAGDGFRLVPLETGG
jgi:glyoxylase-like metal-dependent hydrolase (beta-lactamase superfamily II)